MGKKEPDWTDAEFEVVGEPVTADPSQAESEWAAGHWVAKVVYFVIFFGLMIPIWLAAKWVTGLLFAGW